MDTATQISVIKALLGISLLASTATLIVILGKTLYANWRNNDGEEW